jgi:hypothetical protein
MQTTILNPIRSSLRFAREALYVTVGAGVLAVQRVQVRRRELERRFGGHFRGSSPSSNGATEATT